MVCRSTTAASDEMPTLIMWEFLNRGAGSRREQQAETLAPLRMHASEAVEVSQGLSVAPARHHPDCRMDMRHLIRIGCFCKLRCGSTVRETKSRLPSSDQRASLMEVPRVEPASGRSMDQAGTAGSSVPWPRDMWMRLLRERRLHHEHHPAFGPLIGSVVWVAYVERTSEWNLPVGCDGVFRIGCLAAIQPVRDPGDLKLLAL